PTATLFRSEPRLARAGPRTGPGPLDSMAADPADPGRSDRRRAPDHLGGSGIIRTILVNQPKVLAPGLAARGSAALWLGHDELLRNYRVRPRHAGVGRAPGSPDDLSGPCQGSHPPVCRSYC